MSQSFWLVEIDKRILFHTVRVLRSRRTRRLLADLLKRESSASAFSANTRCTAETRYATIAKNRSISFALSGMKGCVYPGSERDDFIPPSRSFFGSEAEELCYYVCRRRKAEAIPLQFLLKALPQFGYGDSSVFGHPTIRTPSMDRLAREGIRFNRWYSTNPVCSPR